METEFAGEQKASEYFKPSEESRREDERFQVNKLGIHSILHVASPAQAYKTILCLSVAPSPKRNC